jgi:NAD(P)H-quinone oxidoreductase subunit L
MSLLQSGPVMYTLVAGAYLFVIPLALMYYLKARWYVTGSLERAFMCFMVFFFFPGLLLFAPLLNFRPQPRKI